MTPMDGCGCSVVADGLLVDQPPSRRRTTAQPQPVDGAAHLLVHRHRAGGGADGDHRLRRHRDQQVPARDHGLRRRRARHRRRRLARPLLRQRHGARGLSGRAGADRPSLSQPARRHVRRRDRAVRHRRRPDGARAACSGDYDNDGHDDLFVTCMGTEPPVPQPRRRHVRRRDRGGGPDRRRSRAGEPAARSSTTTATATSISSPPTTSISISASAPLPESGLCRYKGIPVACGPPGLTGGKNVLYRNTGKGTFEDVSDRAGITRSERDLRPRRQHARFQRRRVGRSVCGERLEPERALS